jgi:ribosomal-protein-alanine N-acetyltransferase
MRQARSLGTTAIYLEVRPSNPGAIHLYQRTGFRLVGRRRDYYPTFDGREDALVMRRELPRDS